MGGWAGPLPLTEAAKLIASDGGGQLGASVAVSGDVVVVGARLDNDNGFGTGSAYIFEKPVGSWSGTVNETAKLLASDAAVATSIQK